MAAAELPVPPHSCRGEASPSPCTGPLMPCFATLSGWVGWGETRAMYLGAPARLRLHPASCELELGMVPTLAGCSAPTSQIFLISLGWLIFPLLAFTPLSGWRDQLRGGDQWAPLYYAESWLDCCWVYLVTCSYFFCELRLR